MLVPVAVGLAAPKREGVEVAGLAPKREEVLVLPNKDVPATQNVKSCLHSMEVFNRRSTDLHTRIAELGVALQHCEYFFQKTFLEKKLFTFFSEIKLKRLE